jgi:hypothetical protein
VVPRGLEPRTLRLLAVRSNQLSYETNWQCLSDKISQISAPRYKQGAKIQVAPTMAGKGYCARINSTGLSALSSLVWHVLLVIACASYGVIEQKIKNGGGMLANK